MKLSLSFAALLGILIAVALIAQQGFASVASTLHVAGRGLAWVALFHVLPMFFSGWAWHAVASSVWEAPLSLFVWARAVREAVSHLLPVTQIGAEVVGARVLVFHGASAGIAGASVVVDLTMEV